MTRPRQFNIAQLPEVVFGIGSFEKIPLRLSPYGKNLIVVTGASSLQNKPQWQWLSAELAAGGFDWSHIVIETEPGPALIDDMVAQHRDTDIDAVLAIGGGSVLDAGKAIAGLLKPGNSVMDHLEGVGPELPYLGPATPLIAVPTTAGTGSEATKNAVLSRHGPEGFKKSFRDNQLVARLAILDPALLAGTPAQQIAANGMDALTQLLESCVSTRANPFTDALALNGISRVRDSLPDWHRDGDTAIDAQADMLYAAWLSGITLAQVGLGSVHGLAAPLGALSTIPHGVACGCLLARATEVNIDVMRQREPDNRALQKYAEVGRLFCNDPDLDDPHALDSLVRRLYQWTDMLSLPGLGKSGISVQQIPALVALCRGSSMKTNPVVLTDTEIESILTPLI